MKPSDTSRTWSAALMVVGPDGWMTVVPVEVSEQLERELNALMEGAMLNLAVKLATEITQQPP